MGPTQPTPLSYSNGIGALSCQSHAYAPKYNTCNIPAYQLKHFIVKQHFLNIRYRFYDLHIIVFET